MNRIQSATPIPEAELRGRVESDGGLFVCCAGYEERALYAARVVGRPKINSFRVIRLTGGDAANDDAFSNAQITFGDLSAAEVIEYDLRHIAAAGRENSRRLCQQIVLRTISEFTSMFLGCLDTGSVRFCLLYESDSRQTK